MRTDIAQTLCPNLSGGEWLRNSMKTPLERRNPADFDDVIGLVPMSSHSELSDAVDAADAAHAQWKRVPAPQRADILREAASILGEESETLATLLTREQGKTLAEARKEVTVGRQALEYFCGEGRKPYGTTIPSEHIDRFIHTRREPVGIVGIITPWNFPVAVPLWKIAAALVCGNAVVWKPSKLTAFVAWKVADILIRSGVPAGVLNVVNGAGYDIGVALTEHPRVRALSFTCSPEVGVAICSAAAPHFKKLQGETGGKNAVIVLSDADLDAASTNIITGAFGFAGQRCTATSRVIVEERIADDLVSLLYQKAARIQVGNGLIPETDMGPIVDEAQLRRILGFMEIGRRECELIYGGKRLVGGHYDKGYYVEPTIFDHVSPSSPLSQKEIFGPVLSVTRVANVERAIQVANDSSFGMAGGIYTRDLVSAMHIIDRLDCGIVQVNSPTTMTEIQVPFGGHKITGLGPKECGPTGVEFYSQEKVVYMNY